MAMKARTARLSDFVDEIELVAGALARRLIGRLPHPDLLKQFDVEIRDAVPYHVTSIKST